MLSFVKFSTDASTRGMAAGGTSVTLSQDQVDRYFEDGFITVPDAVSPALLAEIRRVTEEIVAGAASLAASDEKLDLEDSHTPEAPRVRRIKSPHANFPFFRDRKSTRLNSSH